MITLIGICSWFQILEAHQNCQEYRGIRYTINPSSCVYIPDVGAFGKCELFPFTNIDDESENDL